MRRGQTGVEYIYLIGIVAAALAAILVYMGRGMQGHTRNQADQIGSGQYDPSATISNTETKRVTSTTTSTSTPNVEYGDQKDRAAKQAAIYNKLVELRIFEQYLADLTEEWKYATIAEAKEQADAINPFQIVVDLGNALANAAKSLFGLGSGGKPAPKEEQWAATKTQLDANKIEAETLAIQWQTADAKADQDPAYREEADRILAKIDDKGWEFDAGGELVPSGEGELQDLQMGYDLMMLNTKEADVPADYLDAYKARMTELIPAGTGTSTTPTTATTPPKEPPYDSVGEAISNIEAIQKQKTKDLQAKYQAQGGPTSDYDPDVIKASQATNQLNLDNIYATIGSIKAPPRIDLQGKTPRSTLFLNSEIAKTRAALAQTVLDYTNLTNDFNALPINLNITSLTNSSSTEFGTITTNKTISETLGDL